MDDQGKQFRQGAGSSRFFGSGTAIPETSLDDCQPFLSCPLSGIVRRGPVPVVTAVPTSLSETGFLFGPGLTADGATWMCRQLVGLLAVDGVAVTVTAGPFRVVVGASDGVSRLLEVAQLTTGLGPCTDATRGGSVVVIGDLPAALPGWPGLDDLLDGAIGSVVAVPLTVGAAAFGTMDVYRRDRHPWTTPEVAAIESAGRLLTFALATMRIPGIGEDNRAWTARVGVEVAQATGIVMGALHLSAADALSRLRAAAFVAGRLLTDIATDVVAGRAVPFLDEAVRGAPGERIGS